MTLHKEHHKRVCLIEGVEDGQQIARVSVRGDGEEVAEGRREEGSELLFGEEFEQRGLEIVYTVLQAGEELHGDVSLSRGILRQKESMRNATTETEWYGEC